MTTETIVLSEEQKVMLDNLAKQYQEACDEYTTAEGKKKAFGDMLKSTLADFGVSKYSSDALGLSLSVSTRKNVSYNEDVLLGILKGTEFANKTIKTKEYVDMEALESEMYHGNIKPELIKESLIVKPDIVTLRCTKKKTLNE